MKSKWLMLLFACLCVASLSLAPALATAGTATNVSTTWQNATTMEQNFDFGYPVSTSATALPTQVKNAITLGTLETYIMAALLWGP
jgi:hypothetical protein